MFLQTLEVANDEQKKQIEILIETNPASKIEQMLSIFKACNVDAWANELKEKYYQLAMKNLEDIAVTETRKKPLMELANFLIEREN